MRGDRADRDLALAVDLQVDAARRRRSSSTLLDPAEVHAEVGDLGVGADAAGGVGVDDELVGLLEPSTVTTLWSGPDAASTTNTTPNTTRLTKIRDRSLRSRRRPSVGRRRGRTSRRPGRSRRRVQRLARWRPGRRVGTGSPRGTPSMKLVEPVEEAADLGPAGGDLGEDGVELLDLADGRPRGGAGRRAGSGRGRAG